MRAWEEFLTLQERELGVETVKKWLRPLKIVRFDACNLYLEAEDSFKTHWFEEHVRHRANKYLSNNNKNPISVHLSIAPHQQQNTPTPKKKTFDWTPPPFKLVFDTLDEKC